MSANETIQNALPRLDQNELRELRGRVSALLGPDTNPDTRGEGLVNDAICEILKAQRGVSPIPHGVLVRMEHYVTFRDGCRHFQAFITEYFQPKSQAERYKLIRLLVGMISRRIASHDVPVSHKTISQALIRVGDAVDDQFPGYLEAGLLPMIGTKFQN